MDNIVQVNPGLYINIAEAVKIEAAKVAAQQAAARPTARASAFQSATALVR